MKSTLVGAMILVATTRAYAIENLECELALATPRTIAVAAQRSVTLNPGQVLIRGTLTARRSASSPRIHYCVRDEVTDHGVFADPRDGLFALSHGDHLFFLADDGHGLRGDAYYGESVETKSWPTDGSAHVDTYVRPLIMSRPEHRQSELSPVEVDNLFRNHARVVVVKTLEADRHERLRQRLLPSIEAHAANRADPARFYAVTATKQYELAHFERAFRGTLRTEMIKKKRARIDLGNGRFEPEKTIYRWVLKLKTAAGDELIASEHDYIYLIDDHDQVVMKFEQREPEIILYHPYDAFEAQLLEALAFAKHMVIIRQN